MNVSVRCEYALRATLDLALADPGVPVRIADIARRQEIPQKFLETILADLKKQGFLESRRGADGGYLLPKSPDSITVGQVIRGIEGNRTGRSAAADAGPLDFFWAGVDKAIAQVIDNTDFATLARAWRERQSRFVPNWEI
ncbi:MAG: Rrf2 family transcriptional regulator [Candidatus Solibacter sp.]|nr:Rrf2 family transcriptional regulator [Candidatus Solibacter sp.]